MTRKPMPAELHEQIPLMKEVLGAMWIREKVDDMEDSVETLEFEIVRLREELKKYGERIRDYEE